ncbi:MAG: glycosyltransferase family 1 protein [Candidatus Moraniibacteriota bacterium]
MQVAIQASDLDHARIDGTRVYLKQLLEYFGPLASEVCFSLYHKGQFNPELAPPSFPNYSVRSLGPAPAWMQTRFAAEMFAVHPDKLFLPIQAAPFFLPKGIEVTATIHDLAFRKFPETFPRPDRLRLNLLLERVVRRADKLIAISESTKRDLLVSFPHLTPERIRVIHHGFDEHFWEKRLPSPELTKELESFGVREKRYFLFVGALQPRKNLERLITAFESVFARYPDYRLVLAGEAAWLSQSIIRRARESVAHQAIVLPGAVSFDQVRALYQGASAFVFPSLYEGFGLPILEAFASRTPVITGRNSSLSEVAGQGALYADILNTEDLALQMIRLIEDETLRSELVERGIQELKRFSWSRTARETLEYILA